MSFDHGGLGSRLRLRLRRRRWRRGHRGRDAHGTPVTTDKRGDEEPCDPFHGIIVPPRSLLRGTGSVFVSPPRRAGFGSGYGLELFVIPGDRTRVLEGKPDPADPSHFTIDYAHNAVPGTIDGWLNADDTVTLAPRAGDVLEWDATYHWWSPAPGGLPPQTYNGAPSGVPAPFNPTTRPVLPKRDNPWLK
jgi:hypothetical protein